MRHMDLYPLPLQFYPEAAAALLTKKQADLGAIAEGALAAGPTRGSIALSPTLTLVPSSAPPPQRRSVSRGP